jgi:predicted acylesterase/phospholipase RssA
MSHDMHCGRVSAFRTAAGMVMFALLISGCAFVMPDKIHYVANPPVQSAASCILEDQEGPADRILGIALSGGGSRAAVFGAATLEALAEHGVLGQISHLSSVSGGSLAASYFLTHPPACEGMPTIEAEQACWREYFTDFKVQMRVNYQAGMMLRNARPTRFTSPTRRAVSLQEVLNKHFLDDKTFGELESDPMVLINATSYDETRRFVFSNVCLPADAVDPAGGSNTQDSKRYQVMAEKALGANALRAFTFSRPECTQPVPSDLPVSLAVVASTAFPPAIGPVAIEVPSGCGDSEPQWWHLGDGGVVENSGTDSLDEIVLRRLVADGPPLEQALILSVDSGVRPDPEQLKRMDNFRMNSNPTLVNLVVITPRVRGQAYHDIFWDEMSGELAKEGIGLEKITFRHSRAELSELPDSCTGKTAAEGSIRDLLLEIPTLLMIDECNADLLEMAAHQLVHTSFDDEAVRRLTGKGFSIHNGRDCAMAH